MPGSTSPIWNWDPRDVEEDKMTKALKKKVELSDKSRKSVVPSQSRLTNYLMEKLKNSYISFSSR